MSPYRALPRRGRRGEKLGRNLPPSPAKAVEPTQPHDLLARDAIKVASISNAADRTMTYRLAIRNLDEIGSYLNQLI